jgi:hypothetical protein
VTEYEGQKENRARKTSNEDRLKSIHRGIQAHAPQPYSGYIELKASRTLQEEVKFFDKWFVSFFRRKKLEDVRFVLFLTVKTNELLKKK